MFAFKTSTPTGTPATTLITLLITIQATGVPAAVGVSGRDVLAPRLDAASARWRPPSDWLPFLAAKRTALMVTPARAAANASNGNYSSARLSRNAAADAVARIQRKYEHNAPVSLTSVTISDAGSVNSPGVDLITESGGGHRNGESNTYGHKGNRGEDQDRYQEGQGEQVEEEEVREEEDDEDRSLSEKITMTVLYGVIFVTGVVGNIGTCVVIATNRYMHTATNYYLFSLSISDLLLLLFGVPNDTMLLWTPDLQLGWAFCITRGFLSETATDASILTITAFTVERYVAICHPLRSHRVSTLERALKTIALVWAAALVSAYPIVSMYGLNDKGVCTAVDPQANLFVLSTLLFFAVPMTLITALYVLIGLRLRRSSAGARRGRAGAASAGDASPETVRAPPALRVTPVASRQSQSPPPAAANTSNPLPPATPEPTGCRSPSANHGATLGSQQQQRSPSTACVSRTPSTASQSQCRRRQQRRQSELSARSGGRESADASGAYNSHAPRHTGGGSKKAVVKMLVAVVISFFVCWTPFHIQRLWAQALAKYDYELGLEENRRMLAVYSIILHISGISYYLSATTNPILYQVMSLKFRQAMRDTLYRCCARCCRCCCNGARLEESGFTVNLYAASTHSSVSRAASVRAVPAPDQPGRHVCLHAATAAAAGRSPPARPHGTRIADNRSSSANNQTRTG